MPTIPLVEDDQLSAAVQPLAARIVAREKRVFGAASMSNVWRCLAHHPRYMQSNWDRSRALVQRGDVLYLNRGDRVPTS